VPEPFVPLFVAMGDAWFPRQRDVDSVIQDLPSDGMLTAEERSVLVSYLTESLVAERNEDRVRTAIEYSPISGDIEPSILQVQKLPSLPKILQGSGTQTSAATNTSGKPRKQPEHQDSGGSTAEVDRSTSPTEQQSKEKALESLQRIPGIGPHRAEKLVDGGVRSLETISEARPTDLAVIDGISEDLATVAIEGAREVLGHTVPANERLKTQTEVEEDVFAPALSSLAAAGIPASEASSTLRVLYGPTVADIDAVSGIQAYFLWEAGYRTPYDVIEASVDELTEVFQVGATTAPEIQSSARNLLKSNFDGMS
jgi:predicted flap endonuclease-1-like 5' DNA nuclease